MGVSKLDCIHEWHGGFKVTTELNWICCFKYYFWSTNSCLFLSLQGIIHAQFSFWPHSSFIWIHKAFLVTISLILGWLCKCCARFFLTDVGFGHLRVGFDHITLSHLQPEFWENFQYNTTCVTRMQKFEHDTIHEINGWPTIWNIPEPRELFVWT